MPFKKLYTTEEDRLEAHKAARKRANDKYRKTEKYRKNQVQNILPKQRENRKKNPHYFLLTAYGNMRNRVLGKSKPHLYKGLPILSRQEFLYWAKEDITFCILFNYWKENGYKLKDRPSINRVDTRKGYTLDNVEWITHSENSKLGALNKHHGGFIR